MGFCIDMVMFGLGGAAGVAGGAGAGVDGATGLALAGAGVTGLGGAGGVCAIRNAVGHTTSKLRKNFIFP